MNQLFPYLSNVKSLSVMYKSLSFRTLSTKNEEKENREIYQLLYGFSEKQTLNSASDGGGHRPASTTNTNMNDQV